MNTGYEANLSLLVAATIICGLIITFSLRGVALLLFSRLTLPAQLRRALPYVPLVVLSAMSFGPVLQAQQALMQTSSFALAPLLPAALVAAAVSWWRRDLYSPILAGALCFFILRQLLA